VSLSSTELKRPTQNTGHSPSRQALVSHFDLQATITRLKMNKQFRRRLCLWPSSQSSNPLRAAHMVSGAGGPPQRGRICAPGHSMVVHSTVMVISRYLQQCVCVQ